MSDERLELLRKKALVVGWLTYDIDDVRYLLDHIAALEDVRDAAVEAVHAAKYPRDLVGNAYATKKLEETLAAAGQGETNNAPGNE